MTPREPDRFDAQARELAKTLYRGWTVTEETIATVSAALRAAESSALERAAEVADQYESRLIANSIRALIPPAAAPAADPGFLPCAAVCSAPGADRGECAKARGYAGYACTCACHPAPAAETGKAEHEFTAPGPGFNQARCGRCGLTRSEHAAPAQRALERKAQAWAAAIEYCEYTFSPEWLADPRNGGIFAAHIYKLLNAARAAPQSGEASRAPKKEV